MGGVRRVLVALLVGGITAGAGIGGYFGWTVHDRDSRLETTWSLLREGRLREANGVAESLRNDYPLHLDSYIVSAWVLRGMHDRPATSDVLRQGYDLAPQGFPMLAEHVDHLLRGPDDPKKGFDTLDFLDQHLARFPSDANEVARGRLVALAYLLGQTSLPEGRLSEVRAQAEAALAAFQIAGVGTTGQHYDRAQTLLALGQFDASIAAGKAGIEAGTDKWQSLVMRWAIATSMLHRGEDEAAWHEMLQIEREIADWPGTHFGMGKPLLELVQLTAGVRFGRKVPAPDGYAERQARLDEEGVRLQYGDEESRVLIAELLTAMTQRDSPRGLERVDDLLAITERDRGCEMENQIIRPNTRAMLLAARGDLQMGRGDMDAAIAAYEESAQIFPEDIWLTTKVHTAKMAKLGEDFNPGNRPRSRAP